MVKLSLRMMSMALCVLSLSCENPAKRSIAAEVADAVEVSETVTAGDKWVFTEESTVRFISSNLTSSHEGGFTTFSGFFHVEGDSLAKNGHEVLIDVNSLYTDNQLLTNHLKEADFFNVEKFPESKFIVTSIVEKHGENGATHELAGNFTLHGVTKSLTIPVVVTQAEDEIRVKANFYINRVDFGVEFGIEFGIDRDELVRREVTILLDLIAEPAAADKT